MARSHVRRLPALAAAALSLALLAGPALAQDCTRITDALSFCPEGTLWEGLPWHRPGDPDAILWETEDLALIIAEIPAVFETGPVEIGQRELSGFLDDMLKPAPDAEEIARFAPLGDDVAAYSRVTRQPSAGLVEYATLYAIGGAILSIRTLARADKLTQDHGLRHEQALRAVTQTGTEQGA